MMFKLISLLAMALCMIIVMTQAMVAQEDGEDSKAEDQKKPEDGNRVLRSLVGQWEGTCRTWFQPGKLADESKIKGEIQPILGERFFRHTYESQMQGKPREGEETLAFNPITQEYQISWFDDFHMSYAIMFSTGKAAENGFVVTGTYEVAPESPAWGWKTVFERIDADHLTITSYNVTPEGEEAKGVEVKYERVR